MYLSATEKAVIGLAGFPAAALADFADISDLHRVTADNVIDGARTVIFVEDQLRTKIATARRDLDNAEVALEAGHAISTNGILKGIGPVIDTLAVRRQDAYQHLAAACRTAAALDTRADDLR